MILLSSLDPAWARRVPRRALPRSDNLRKGIRPQTTAPHSTMTSRGVSAVIASGPRKASESMDPMHSPSQSGSQCSVAVSQRETNFQTGLSVECVQIKRRRRRFRREKHISDITRQLAFCLVSQCLSHEGVIIPRIAVFMIGLPGAGKSTVIRSRYKISTNSTLVIDLDSEMMSHPRYNPRDPNALYIEEGQKPYHWANARVDKRFKDALVDPCLSRVVLDGTGTNTQRQLLRMNEARTAGWFVKVIYVQVDACTAIARAARRSRYVSPEKILWYQSKIDDAIAVAKEHADAVETVECTADRLLSSACALDSLWLASIAC